MNEPLDQLVLAFRTDPVDHGAARVTRARVLAGHAERTHKRSLLRAFGWIAGATLCGSTAMAAVAHGPQAVALVTSLWAEPATPPRVAPRRKSVAVNDHAAASPAQPVAALPVDTQPAAAASAATASSPAGTAMQAPATREARAQTARRSARPLREATPPARASATDPELALFDRAHRLHFDGGEAQAAVAAWDAYLERFPSGRFELEARYNRGLALLRAQRGAEARAALLPFANGEAGDYRRREARALLHRLGER